MGELNKQKLIEISIFVGFAILVALILYDLTKTLIIKNFEIKFAIVIKSFWN